MRTAPHGVPEQPATARPVRYPGAALSAAPTPSSPRLLGLDALRGLAVFLMIEQHLGVWLWRGPQPGQTLRDHLPLVAFNALGGGAAPLFVTLAGIGSALFVRAGRPHPDRVMLVRGLVLMAMGTALNLLTPSWFSWGSWFVLHMMGLAMALTALWRRLPTPAVLGLAFVVLLATAAIQHALHTPPILTNARMRNVHLPGGPLRLAVAEGQFPVFPWLAFYLAGVAAGRWIGAGRLRPVLALGLGCLALGVTLALAGRLGLVPRDMPVLRRMTWIGLGFYPASTAMAALLMAVPLLLTAGVMRLRARWPTSPRDPAVTLGRASLTLLMLHVVMFREWTRPLGLWRANSAPVALAILLVFVVLATWASRRWQRAGYRYGAEWLLRRLSAPSAPSSST